MGRVNAWGLLTRLLPRKHGPVKSFDQELEAAGGLAGRYDAGVKIVPTQKVVGSVGRARNLRSDFFYRSGQAVTERFLRIGRAMERGVALPPLELYKVKLRRRQGEQTQQVSEYYVVDGHHRVAMARKLGQDFLDAHVVEYKVPDGAPTVPLGPPIHPAAPAPPEQWDGDEARGAPLA